MTRRQHAQRQPQHHTDAAPPHHQEQRACARDQFCKQATVTWDGDKRIVHPALTYRPFCDGDRDDVVTALVAFPGQYRQLLADLHDIRSTGQVPGAAFGSRLPLYGDIDAAARRIHLVVTSWEARIREVPRIDSADVDDDGQAAAEDPSVRQVRVAATVLHRNVDALLALEPAWMIRYAPAGRLRDNQLTAMQAVHRLDYWDERRSAMPDLEVRIYDELDGARAGLEILHLHHVCRRILGEIDRKPDNLPGVACYRCQHKALRRADPPLRDNDPLYYSRCKVCDHQLTEPEYRDHVKRLAALVGGKRTASLGLQGVSARRSHPGCVSRNIGTARSACPDPGRAA
jgi:hypothetical protein